ncbi:hypothetical protein IU448_28440 [Nocardia flavorosea]|uniref:effector-associated constant component EACC1 n=1 Tax=Nocardia flavorosea TaxID=53429 RepID=UPI0018935060|nr:hypothetical protein [Nocardia flavorosea]MBF6352910.1 hypothetical protein [Nocardia flavorosea]
MELLVEVSGAASADVVSGARRWLLDEPELRGRVTLQRQPAEPGTMSGELVGGLLIWLGSGSAALVTARVAANVLIAWLKTRRGDVSVTVIGPGGTSGSVNVSNVKSLSAADLDALVDRVVGLAGSPEPVNDEQSARQDPREPEDPDGC